MEPVLKRADDIEAFLSELLEDVISHNQFQSLYPGNVGNVESELSRLLVALRVNRENMFNTSREAEMFPNDLLLQSQVSGHRRGLEAALTQAEVLWIRLRDELDEGATELSRQVEEGEVHPREGIDGRSISVRLLDALKKVRKILAASLDVTKVAAEYLPVIVAIREALDSLQLTTG